MAGFILFFASLGCIVIGMIILIIGGLSNEKKITRTGLRTLLAGGILMLLSAAFCTLWFR
jgi:nucleoside permease NupC